MFEELIKKDKEDYLNNYTEIDIEGVKVKVYKKIPIELKKGIVDTVLSYSIDNNGIYNELLIDTFFAVSILESYTDIEIDTSEESGITGVDIYNYFNNRGYFTDIVNAIDEDEYKQLFNYVITQRAANEKGHIGIINFINNLVSNFPNPNELKENLEAVLKDIELSKADKTEK